MNDLKIKRIRAQSARTHHENKRPFSGKPNQVLEKSEAVQKIYAQIPFLEDKALTLKNKPRINSSKFNYKLCNTFSQNVDK